MKVNENIKSLIKLFNNKGMKNLSMKAFVKGCFFLFNLYIINTFPIEQVADFAIFYTTARFLSFFGSDSMHITRFAEIRNIHLGAKEDNVVIDKIKTHLLISHSLLFIISIFIFNDIKWVFYVNIVAIVFSAIRLLADFSKINNTIRMSIIIEDLFFTLGFILLSVVFIQFFGNVIFSVFLAISICGISTIVYSLLHFKKQLGINFFAFGKFNFNISNFWFSNKFTLLKGITVFVLYLTRQAGDFYYGDKMVAETHLLIILINVFTLVSTSIVAGFQNEIVLHDNVVINRKKFLEIYKKLTIPILYFIFIFGGLLIIFAKDFLLLIAPNFAYLKTQFIYTILLVLLYFIVNPVFYFFYMNKKVHNYKNFIISGYLLLIMVVISGHMIENYWIWFFAMISILIMVPIQVAISGLINLKK